MPGRSVACSGGDLLAVCEAAGKIPLRRLQLPVGATIRDSDTV